MSFAPRALPLVLAGLIAFASPAPAVQGDAERPRAAGTEVPAPKRTRFVPPRYPALAQARGLRGIVILELVIDVQGRVSSVTVVRSVPEFDEAAVAAARQWVYEVSKVEGKPVPVRITVPITFAMKLPEVKSAAGIPPLRGGVSPSLPAGATGGSTVEATLTVDPQGHITEAAITSGQPPFSDAVMSALRTWRFGSVEAGYPLSFTLRAEFAVVSGGGTPRVDLELKDPRRAEAVAAAAAAEPSPEPVAPPITTTGPAAPDASPAPTAPAAPVTAAPAPPATAAPDPSAGASAAAPPSVAPPPPPRRASPPSVT